MNGLEGASNILFITIVETQYQQQQKDKASYFTHNTFNVIRLKVILN
jgi:hypothetical protein